MECGEWTLESVKRLEMESIERGKECGDGEYSVKSVEGVERMKCGQSGVGLLVLPVWCASLCQFNCM